jgi:hypothetical protein
VIEASNFSSPGTIAILVHLIRNEHMSLKRILSFTVTIFAATQLAAQPAKSGRAVDVKSADGIILKARYFAAGKPGPGVLLFHQSNRTLQSWDDVAEQLAHVGINTLSVDSRGSGDYRRGWKPLRPADLDAAIDHLTAQPGVNRDVIGIGGAGVLGVENSIEMARRHPAQVKLLVLLSGEASRPQLQFLHDASQLPGLFVVSDEDEYPPIEEGMELLYASASSPAKKLIHYAAEEQAPWRWYEPFDIGKVPAKGGHGTDLFKPHPELSDIIVHWFVTTLLKTPGHAPADAIAAAPLLAEVEFENGVGHAQQLLEQARKKDPKAQLWPEISMSIVGQDFMREGDVKHGLEVFRLNVLAYPDSADANDSLADGYLKDGQKDLARKHAEKALAILDAHAVPASSWTDTDEYRGELRRSLQKTLRKVSEKQGQGDKENG